VIHGLASSSKVIYVNQEQSPKSPPEGATQESITSAFGNHQRQSNYIFKYAGTQYVLLSGKNTGRAGVIQLKGPDGKDVDVTDLERTLIDIVVRPAYAGGTNQVADPYKHALDKIDVDHLTKLLKKMQYVYPYHQSIGFLLERAGGTEKDWRRLKNLGTDFDFYLDYKMKSPAYNKDWRLYYPPILH
jgi:predicted transcriptional regulator of viral defense system